MTFVEAIKEKVAQLTALVPSIKTAFKTAADKLAELTTTNAQLVTQLGTLQAQLQDALNKNVELQALLQDTVNQLSEKSLAVDTLNVQLASLSTANTALQAHLDEAIAKQQELQAQAAELESVPQQIAEDIQGLTDAVITNTGVTEDAGSVATTEGN